VKTDPANLPHVVILGGGFGGLSAAKALAKAPVRVTLIDRRNHHLFQPLLYQVAAAALSPAQIAYPIRAILRRQANATVLLGEVAAIDPDKRDIRLAGANGARMHFDYLVVATGAQSFYFGHDDWQPYAIGLKSLEDAIELRRRMLLAFERAEAETDPVEKRNLLSFAIIGAGPTGVELAGAIAEIARHALASDFRHIDSRSTRVVLIEAGPRILAGFEPPLAADAQRRLVALGVEVRVSSPVQSCNRDGVVIGDELVPARTIIWAAGVAASPAARWLGAPADRTGRVIVDPDFSVPGHEGIFVVGDTSSALRKDGKPLPGLAPVAKQQGHYVGRVIAAHVMGRPHPRPFRYRNYGNLATIGRSAAIADFGWLKLTGFLGWVMWSMVHIFYLIGFRNRLIVALDWFWAYLTFERGARLITHCDSPPDASEAEQPRSVAKTGTDHR
jgi:NADH dehydrogenase